MGIVKTHGVLSASKKSRCFIAVLLLSLTLLSFAGCSAGGLPPVTDRSRVTNTAASPGEYVVVAGDTLYSIAWRHQRDFRTLARLNRIRKPYDIYPGQRLRVKGPLKSAAAKPPLAKAPARRAQPQPQANSSTPKPSVPHPLSQTQPKPQWQSAASSTKRGKPKGAQTVQPQPGNGSGSSKPSGIGAQLAGSGPVKLRWPSSGTRVRKFGEQAAGAQKPSVSVNFLLKPGASIRSSAAGEVVYVGQGLAGFEQFVIVKHNDTWLSAYGFNAPATVREKQLLSSGTVLATLASTPGANDGLSRRRQLHFELRKNGKPVNPAAVIN